MEEKVGFVTMGAAGSGADVGMIGVGMLGYAFMGKAHSNAYKTSLYMTWPPPLMPQLVSIAGRDEAPSEAAARYGFEGYVTDWHELIGDERIGLFDNSGPNNLHTEPSIGRRGRPRDLRSRSAVTPPSRTTPGSAAAGVKHMCASTTASCRPCGWREIIELTSARSPLPRLLPAGVGDRRRRGLALRQGARGLGALGISART